MARPNTRKRKTALVPRVLLSATFISVVPACALSACGGPDPLLQLGPVFGVAAVAFDAFSGADGVAADAFVVDSGADGVAADAFIVDASADAASDVIGDVAPDASD